MQILLDKILKLVEKTEDFKPRESRMEIPSMCFLFLVFRVMRSGHIRLSLESCYLQQEVMDVMTNSLQLS